MLKNFQEKMLITWYLTEDEKENGKKEKKGDGNRLEYLKENKRKNYESFDKELYGELKELLCDENCKIIKEKRSVKNVEPLFEDKVQFFHKLVPENQSDRKKWFEEMKNIAKNCGVVFIDPDNGIKFSNGQSVKHALYSEVESLWNNSFSIIIYQHYPHVDRDVFSYGLAMKLALLLESTDKKCLVSYVKIGDVVYYFILHERDIEKYRNFIKEWRTKFGLLSSIDKYEKDKSQDIFEFEVGSGKEICVKYLNCKE